MGKHRAWVVAVMAVALTAVLAGVPASAKRPPDKAGPPGTEPAPPVATVLTVQPPGHRFPFISCGFDNCGYINPSATSMGATLRTTGGAVVAGKWIYLRGNNGVACAAVTGSDGFGGCTRESPELLLPATQVDASFAGDEYHLPTTSSWPAVPTR